MQIGMISCSIESCEGVIIIKQTNKTLVSKIPQFKSREEEAKFWETHSISDYTNELKPIEARFAKNLSEGLHIRLDPDTLVKLRHEAQAKGIGPTTLVRMWIREQLGSSSHST